MNPPPFNDGLFGGTASVIKSQSWRQWLSGLVSGMGFSIYTIPDTSGVSPVIAVNWSNGRAQAVTLGHTGTATMAFSGGTPGGMYRLVMNQGVAGGHLVNLTIPGVKWDGGVVPTQAIGAGDKQVITFYYDGTDYLGTWTDAF